MQGVTRIGATYEMEYDIIIRCEVGVGWPFCLERDGTEDQKLLFKWDLPPFHRTRSGGPSITIPGGADRPKTETPQGQAGG
jgi:hypothetical protein